MISHLVPICLIAFLAVSAAGIVIAGWHLWLGKAGSVVLRPFDVEAFAIVLDLEDERFLKSRLSESAFRCLKRKRIRLALRYLDRVSANMRAILRIRNTEWLTATSNAQFDSAASLASDMASRIRMQCLIAYAQLSLEFLFPTHQFTAPSLIGDYRSLKAVLAEMRKMAAQSQLAAVPVI